MSLTSQESQRIVDLLRQESTDKRSRLLKSFESFCAWFRIVAYVIYLKIKDTLRKFWEWIRDIFSW